MADDVVLPATGTGTPDVRVAADERTIGAQSVKVQHIVKVGSTTNIATQVAVTNTSTTIVSARDTRSALLLVNQQTVAVYIDPSGGTATTSMFRLDPGAGLALPVTSAVTGITSAAYTASGDARVHGIGVHD